MKDKDIVRRFTFVDEPIRGQLVTLDSSWQQILDRCDAGTFAKHC